MNFSDILIYLKEGKRVRRQCWDKKEFIYFDSMCIVDEQGLEYLIDVNDLFADDWYVFG